MTTEERQARLDFFIKLKNVEYYPEVSSGDKEECMPLLQNMKEGKYFIIPPKHVFKNAKFLSNVAPHNCDDDNVRTMYIPVNSPKGYDFKSTPEFNIEYYDLSKYTDSNLLGIFAEGGKLECNIGNRSDCELLASNNTGAYKIGTVFDADTCNIVLGPNFVSDSRLMWKENTNLTYNENPSFFAFINIRDQIYRMAFNINARWANFKDVISPNGASIILININNQKKCSFFTDDLIK